jgi:hypothetical protein
MVKRGRIRNVIMEHACRRIIHLNVTAHPTSAWTLQQLREVIPSDHRYLNRRLKGKLNTVIEQIEHGHQVFRAYWKHAFSKQYEKFSTFLRNELCSNNLRDFGLKKGLDHLDAVRKTFLAITDRFATFQAQWLNVHVDFPLLQRIALPTTVGSVRYPGIKLHDPRIIRFVTGTVLPPIAVRTTRSLSASSRASTTKSASFNAVLIGLRDEQYLRL